MKISGISSLLPFVLSFAMQASASSSSSIRGAMLATNVGSAGTTYNNVQLCMETNTKASNDHYFWLALENSNKKKIGACLLTIPDGWKSGTNACCRAHNSTGGHDINYDVKGYFGVADPATVTDTSSQQYTLCGAAGGSACPNYNYKHNEIGFQNFKVQDGNGNDISDGVHLWIHKNNGCGLTHKADTLCYGKPEYKHFHVGKGYCLEAGSTLELDARCGATSASTEIAKKKLSPLAWLLLKAPGLLCTLQLF